MFRIRRPRRFCLLCVAFAVACTSDPITLCGCSPPPDVAVLYGRVTNAAGTAVPNARVVAEHGQSGCPSPLQTLGEVRTEADGSYRALLTAYTQPPRLDDCLRAYATPPAGSSLRGSDTVAFRVTFAIGNPLDSARVDLVLRAPPVSSAR